MEAETTTRAVDGHTMIPDLLRRYPHVLAVFDRYGLHGCGGARSAHSKPSKPAHRVG